MPQTTMKGLRFFSRLRRDTRRSSRSITVFSEHRVHRGLSLQVLIDAGADVNAEDNEGWTPLLGASILGSTDVVEVILNVLTLRLLNRSAVQKVLLDNGADTEAKTDFGATALLAAAALGYPEIVKVALFLYSLPCHHYRRFSS